MKIRSKNLFPTEERHKRALWLKKAAPALEAAEKQVESLIMKTKKQNTQIRVLLHQYTDLEEAYSMLENEFAEYKEAQNVNTNKSNEIPPGSANSD